MSRPIVVTRRGAYHDSVKLMLVSSAAAAVSGVVDVAVAMATPLNVALIAERFGAETLDGLGPDDLVIAIRGEDAAAADRALAVVEAELSADPGELGAGPIQQEAARSLVAAARRRPPATVALVSVPGPHAAYEIARALDAGLHVFCFSNGVGIEAERGLKRRALDQGLLLMGPDCGTAIVDGVALGFANVVARGPVGIVGASGTGIQELCSLLDGAGVGISHAIGVGGRDLSAEVGGAMARRGLELLSADPATEAVVVISKPPDARVASELAALAWSSGKPTVLAFLGLPDGDRPPAGDGVGFAATVEEAAHATLGILGVAPAAGPAGPPPAMPSGSGWIRGLYGGGTLCLEAMLTVSAAVGKVASNVPLRPEWRLAEIATSDGHTFIDYGSDELTSGRAHPMIDPALRLARLTREAADPSVAVVLLDIVLGYGAHDDPARAYTPAIAEALGSRSDLAIVVSLCGTRRDPQGLERQRERFEAAGALVVASAAAAGRLALERSGAELGGRV